MNVLITGGAGFAGSGLVKMLLNSGNNVKVVDFIGPLQAESLWEVKEDPNFTHVWKALQDINATDLEGIDTVIHLAAQADVPMGFLSPRWTVEQNVMGTVSLLGAIKDYGCLDKFILAGSGNEFGRPVYLPIDENHPLTPHNPYAFSKAAEEMAGWAWHRCYNTPLTVMSNGACLGPWMRREIFIFKWLYNILRDKPVVLEGGDQTRDLTYVSDILDAWMLVIMASKSVVNGEKFQVSYGEEHSVREILEWCFEVCGKRTEIIERPHRPGEEGQRELFSNMKARTVLGYNPVVSPKEGIILTKEWIEKELIK